VVDHVARDRVRARAGARMCRRRSENPTAIWRFRLEPNHGGTELSQWMQMGPARSGLSFAIDRMPDKEQKIVFVRIREFEQNMAFTLEQIKKLAGG
jgi:hypothetical protein